MAKKSNMKFSDDVSTDDVDMTALHEAQTAMGPKHLRGVRTLMLNADYQPLSYKPLSTKPWQDIFFWLSKGWQREKEGKPPIIHVVEEYEDLYVHSGSEKFKIPAVVALTKMAPMPQKAPYTRNNIFLRDDYTCQYTGIKYPVSELNLDHVYPESRGGKSNWTNIVACHKDINFKKADRTPKEAGLKLIREPYVPSPWELREKGRNYPSQFAHESWADYVYYNVELDED